MTGYKMGRPSANPQPLYFDRPPALGQDDRVLRPLNGISVVYLQSGQTMEQGHQHAAEIGEERTCGNGTVRMIQPILQTLVKPRHVVGGIALLEQREARSRSFAIAAHAG